MMYVITVTCAIGFAITGAWYIVFDIISKETKATVLDGSASLLLGKHNRVTQ